MNERNGDLGTKSKMAFEVEHVAARRAGTLVRSWLEDDVETPSGCKFIDAKLYSGFMFKIGKSEKKKIF